MQLTEKASHSTELERVESEPAVSNRLTDTPELHVIIGVTRMGRGV